MVASFELPACQRRRPIAPPSILIRGVAAPARATVRFAAGAAEVTWKPATFVPATEPLEREEFFAPLIANTCSSEARPPFDEVGVPPTVTATYSLPPALNTVGPLAIGRPVWNVQRIFPVLSANARNTPSPPPAKPTPPAVAVTPPRSGSGVWNFQTRRAELTSIALIEPWSCQFWRAVPKLPFSRPRYTSPSRNLRRFCVGVSFCWISTAAVSAAALKT